MTTKPRPFGYYAKEMAKRCLCPAVTHPECGWQADPIWIVNPLEVENPNGNRWGYNVNHNRVIGFSFGAYGCTMLAVIGKSMESALEDAAEWLAEFAPGHITPEGSETMCELYLDAYREIANRPDATVVPWDEMDDDMRCNVHDQATADLTYTESGYLNSWEWTAVYLEASDPLAQKIIRKALDYYRKNYGENPT